MRTVRAGFVLLVLPVVLPVAVAGAGCDRGGAAGGFATRPESSVLVAGVRAVTLASLGGGLHGPPPAGAPCDPYLWSYTFALDSGRLAFTGCRVQGDPALPESFVPASEDIALDGPEAETLTAAVHAVKVSARRECGFDADTRELTVESADGALTYGDDFYGCVRNYEQFVKWEGLENLQTVVFALGG